MPSGNPNIKKYGFKKGDKRINRNGAPRSQKRIPDLLRKFGEWECPESLIDKIKVMFPKTKKKGLTLYDAVALRVWMSALQNEPWAVQFIAERTEGKVAQELTGAGGKDLIPAQYDLSKLSTKELLALKGMQEKIEIKDTANE